MTIPIINYVAVNRFITPPNTLAGKIPASMVSDVILSAFASWARDTSHENYIDLRADWPSGVTSSKTAAQKIHR